MFLLDSMATGITAIPLAPTYIICSSWIMWPRTFLCGITTFILITSPTIKYVLLGSCGQDNLLWTDRMFRLLHGQSATGAPMLRRPLMIQLLCLAFMFRGRRLGSWSWLHWKGILILRKDRFPVQVMVGFPMARKRGSPNHWTTKMLGSVRFAKEVLVLIWWHGIGNVVDIYIYSWGSWEYIWDLLIFVLWKNICMLFPRNFWKHKCRVDSKFWSIFPTLQPACYPTRVLLQWHPGVATLSVPAKRKQ